MVYVWGFLEQSGKEGGGGGRVKEERAKRQGQQHGIVAPREEKLTGGHFKKQE